MENGIVRLSRVELYRLVWEKPLSKIAKDLGISDVGLAKICDRFLIPRPVQGHWVRVRLGTALAPKALPDFDGSEEITVERSFSRRARYAKPQAALIVSVPSFLENPSSIVEVVQRRFEKAHVDERGLVVAPGPASPTVEVSPKTADRALRILDCLIKTLEARGHRVSMTRKNGAALCSTFDGEEVYLSLKEKLERKPHQLTAKEKKEKARYSWTRVPTHDHTPTGNLRIHLSGLERMGIQQTWSDGRRSSLDDKIGSVVAGIEQAAAAIGDQCRRREESRKRWEEEETRRMEETQRRAEERRHIEGLLKLSEEWEMHRRLSAFLDAIEQAGSDDSAPDINRRLECARGVANRFDPLSDDLWQSMRSRTERCESN